MARTTTGWFWRLALLALGGLLLRLYGINFGLPGLYDPDELMFELGAIRMLSHATLNPGWFGHPATTTMYLLALCNVATFGFGHVMGWFASLKAFGDAVYVNPAWVILPGRVLMALFGAGTIWHTGRLGEELFSRRVGLMGAALVAISPLTIAWAQVIRSDIMGTFFVLLCLRATVRAGDTGRWQDDMRAAIWLGVAVATKWPMALAGAGMAAILAHDLARGRTGLLASCQRMVRFGAMSLLSLVVTSPYLIIAFPTVLHNLHGEAQLHHLGATGGSFLFNAWWYVRGPLLRGLGPAGLVLAIAGLLQLARPRRAGVPIAAVLLAMTVVICGQTLVWDRWMLPILPLTALVAAHGLDRFFVILCGRMPGRKGGAAAVQFLAVLAVFVPLAIADQDQAAGRMNDTRKRASAWAVAHIPAGSSVMIEHFGFDLYPQPWRVLFPLAEMGCVNARDLLKGKVSYSVIDTVRAGRANIDYGTMPAQRAETCRTDFAILTQFDRYKDEKDIFPQEYNAYLQLIQHGRIVANFTPEPGMSSGPVVKIIDFRPVTVAQSEASTGESLRR